MNDAGMRIERIEHPGERERKGDRRISRWLVLASVAWVLSTGSAWAQAGPAAKPAAKPAAQSETEPAEPASAQPVVPAEPFSGIEEMVVVGSEIVNSLTPTSTAVTSFDALQLEALGVSDISNLAAYTPNLEIRTASSTTATFFIRGVGLNDFTANAASAVAVYVDDAPRNLPAIQLGLLYDLENVEIQKGPQGSGPGRNASAGAIRIVTKKPKGEYDAYFNMDYGNYNLIDIEGGLEVPIIEDVLGIRSAFRMKTRDGIVTNRCGEIAVVPTNVSVCDEVPNQDPNVPTVIRPGLEKDLNNTDTWATRSSLRFLPPVDDMEWNLVGHVDRVDQLGTVGQHLGTNPNLGGQDGDDYQAREVRQELVEIKASLPTPPRPRECTNLPTQPQRDACFALIASLDKQATTRLAQHMAGRPLDKLPFEGDYNTPGFERQTSFGGTLSGDWQIGNLTLKNITGFERYDRERLIDADYSPNVTFEFDIEDDAWQVTEDLRLGGELERLPLRWNTGAFYLQETLNYVQVTLANGGAVEPIRQQYDQMTKSFGIFADLSYDLLDDLTFDAGARYNWEQKRFEADISRGAVLQPQCDPLPGETDIPPCQRSDTVDHPTGTLGLTYRYDDLRELYFKYSHGWKGLQYNARDGQVRSQVTDVADPEVIDAFELGFKGDWWDEKISVDGALFWYAYQNYQVFTFINSPQAAAVRVVINADDAVNFGAELSTTIRPVEGLTADVRFGWLETKFLDFTSSGTRPPPTGNQPIQVVLDYNGNQLPNAPRFKISAGLEYAFDLHRFGTLTPRYDLAWTDSVNFDPSNGRGSPNYTGTIFMPAHTIGQRSYALHSVSLRYIAPSEHVELAVWARNITNEVYKTLSFDASAGPGFVGNLVGDPRTYGLTFKVSY